MSTTTVHQKILILIEHNVENRKSRVHDIFIVPEVLCELEGAEMEEFVDEIYYRVKKKDDWTYDDIREALRIEGFEQVLTENTYIWGELMP